MLCLVDVSFLLTTVTLPRYICYLNAHVLTTFSYHVINRCTFRVERPHCLLYDAVIISDCYSVFGRITGEL